MTQQQDQSQGEKEADEQYCGVDEERRRGKEKLLPYEMD